LRHTKTFNVPKPTEPAAVYVLPKKNMSPPKDQEEPIPKKSASLNPKKRKAHEANITLEAAEMIEDVIIEKPTKQLKDNDG
jgi:hypothetical protein